jgi:hypothetical protein
MVELVTYHKVPIASKAAAKLYILTGAILLIVGVWQGISGNTMGAALLILVGILEFTCGIFALYPNSRIQAILYIVFGTCVIMMGLWYNSRGFDYIIPTAILIIFGIGLYIAAILSFYNLSIIVKPTS